MYRTTLPPPIRNSGNRGLGTNSFGGAAFLDREQILFAAHAPAISARVAVLAHHAMARDCDRHRIARARAGYSPSRFRPADPLGHFAIARGVAGGDRAELLPHQALEGRCLNVER